MDLWRSFWRLGVSRRRLVAEAGALLLLTRVGLRLCAYTRLRRTLDLLASYIRADSSASTIGHVDVAWAVRAVARRMPMKSTCLVEALATDTMLRRRHHDSHLHFGVRLNDRNPPLNAHAWVECEGDLVIGVLDDLKDYTPLAR